MANRDEIKKVILDVAGNPEAGVIPQLADKWADAIASLGTDKPYTPGAKDADGDGIVQEGTRFERPAIEKRVTKTAETR
jgi:hypothetical protein